MYGVSNRIILVHNILSLSRNILFGLELDNFSRDTHSEKYRSQVKHIDDE